MKFLDERNARTPGRELRALLRSGELVLGGGAHDALSARIVQETGYPLCVVTGAGVSMCRGYPDVGFVTMEEMVANARYIAEAVRIPVVVDADNGYGNALNVMRTVREFERAGVAGIHIEDQAWPKRCGHMFGKRLIPKEEMAGKIRAALDARRDEDFVIIARCDAVMVEGLAKTLERGEAYLEAGADMLFFEMRESMEEIEAMARQFRGRIPLHYNHSPSGMVPRLHVDEIRSAGLFHRVLLRARADGGVQDDARGAHRDPRDRQLGVGARSHGRLRGVLGIEPPAGDPRAGEEIWRMRARGAGKHGGGYLPTRCASSSSRTRSARWSTRWCSPSSASPIPRSCATRWISPARSAIATAA